MRYRLLDYMYTTFHEAHTTGTPVLHPLWYQFPKDANTFQIDTQFLYGASILVSPVLDENSTTVRAYYPDAPFYDFHTLAKTHVKGGGFIEHTDVNFTSIPVSIRGGVVLPLRATGAMTTTELRKTDFELVVAPAADGTASGSLYLDDGVSITPKTKTTVSFAYKAQKLTVKGSFGHPTGVDVARVRFLDVQHAPKSVKYNGKAVAKDALTFDAQSGVLDVVLKVPFKQGFTVEFQ